MRITYIQQYFNTPEMIGGSRPYEMARRLVSMGYEVNLITSWREDDGRSGWFETDEAGIRVHWIPIPYSNDMEYRKRIRAFFLFAWRAARRAASIPADLVFGSSTPLTVALPAAYAAKRLKVPMVFEVRDAWPDLPIAVGALRNPVAKRSARLLERFAYRSSEHVVALSPGMREAVIKRGFPRDRISVIPNSADLELFDPGHQDALSFRKAHPELGRSPLAVYVGTMGAINGIDYLPRIAAAAARSGSNAVFATVGRGGCEEKVRREADRLGVLGVNFFMFPPVQKSLVPEVLASADLALSLFVDLPAMHANSANKFFDALASGTAVGINYGGWQADLLWKYGAGLVFPPNQPERAAADIVDFLRDEKRVARAGAAARALAEQCFSRDELAQQLAGILESAVQSYSPTGKNSRLR